ncbi:Rv1733c family protein [Streptomyces sp. NPDC054940]
MRRSRTSDALPTVHGGRQPFTEVTVRWMEPGNGLRTATALVAVGTRAGETVDVWLDSRGRSVAPPPDGTAVWQHTVTLGVCAAGGAVAVILLGPTVVRHTAMRRRLAEWEREWARTEPDWTGRRA